jgi:hypothetical protein
MREPLRPGPTENSSRPSSSDTWSVSEMLFTK